MSGRGKGSNSLCGGRKATVRKVSGSYASLLSQMTYVVSLIDECVACVELSPRYRIVITLNFGVGLRSAFCV